MPLKARKGAMIIQAHGCATASYVPRFCYHAQAQHRGQLPHVPGRGREGAEADAGLRHASVMEGMKIFTKSPKALAAQKATMEFLLINHPLDCPICDQGGECELQDLAMGYGRDASRYTERKRVVADEDIGPLISTDMTRCIHCTRCVRFGQRHRRPCPSSAPPAAARTCVIGTFIAKSVDHELSGNVIDLCPVGALNSKPFRMRGRSWEMQQVALVSPHDAHRLQPVGPCAARQADARGAARERRSMNESWISDRDRFGYEGIHSADRLLKPMVKRDGAWHEVGWEQALEAAAAGLKAAGAAAPVGLAALFGASSTLEEFHLGQKLTRGLGSDDLDHRLGHSDFRDGAQAPIPVLGRRSRSSSSSPVCSRSGSTCARTRRCSAIACARQRSAARRSRCSGRVRRRCASPPNSTRPTRRAWCACSPGCSPRSPNTPSAPCRRRSL